MFSTTSLRRSGHNLVKRHKDDREEISLPFLDRPVPFLSRPGVLLAVETIDIVHMPGRDQERMIESVAFVG